MQTLAHRLEEDIKDGLSIRAVARKAKVSDSTIRRILNGKRAAITTLDKLADNLFHLPHEEIYRWAGVLPPHEKGNPLNTEWLLSKLVEVYNRLPLSAQARVFEEAQRLLEEQQRNHHHK